MKPLSRPCLLLSAGFLFLAASLGAQSRDTRVVVSATAIPEFETVVGEREYFTYHLAEGKYFGGVGRDSSLRGTTFEDVARSVAEALAEQSYYPARNRDGGDLLIVVSWGTTSIDEKLTDLLAIDNFGGINDVDFGPEPPQDGSVPDIPDFTAADAGALNTLDVTSSSSRRVRNARLLGYNKGIGDARGLEARREQERLGEDLEEERYFIVLNAIDLPYLRETGKTRELWSTRYSVRNRGTNFQDAVVLLNKAAKGAFGVNLDTLHAAYVDLQATTETGELQVIGIEPILSQRPSDQEESD